MTRFIIPLAIALALSGCSHFSAVHESDAKSDTKKEEGKRYPMQGDIKGLEADTKTAVIDAGKIGDWMDPMTMPYPVKPDKEFQKLHVGDHIEATVVVNAPDYYVTDVKVTPKK
jgi:Cu/Ag efflux protein CusF